MKKSTGITLGLIMSTLILAGCDDNTRCVDANGIVVEDGKCREEEKKKEQGRSSGGFHWYAGGTGYRVGERASGGSLHSVSRGGFGRLAALHGASGG
jgi:hypothetical protein